MSKTLREITQLDELTGRTLAGYNKASAKDMRRLVGAVGAGFNSLGWANKKAKQREKGIGQATDRMRGMYNRKGYDQSDQTYDDEGRVTSTTFQKSKTPTRGKYHAEETEINETDTILLTVPLFIRMLEWGREDAKTDMDLHKATENILDMQDDDVLDMDSYEDIVDINEGQLDEGVKIKRKVGRADIKTSGDLSREKRERSGAAKDAIKRMKESGKKIRFQSFGRWDSKRKSAREKMED